MARVLFTRHQLAYANPAGYEKTARARVAYYPKLKRYTSILFQEREGWPWPLHMQWVATAPRTHIVAWAKKQAKGH